jgi:hypothetical protein
VRLARARWLRAGAVAGLVAAALSVVVHDSPASAASSVPGSYTSVTPARLLDTRSTGGPVASNDTVVLRVDGYGGIPASGVSAVVLRVTVTQPTSSGWVAVWGSGALPNASNINFAAGQVVGNLVTTPVAPDGSVSLYNGSPGTVQLVVDVSGYYLAGTPQAAGTFSSVTSYRVLDTRNGTGAPKKAVTAGQTVDVQVDGVGPVPSSDVSAVVLNLTVTQPATNGWVAVWGGGAQPTASSLNFQSGQVIANLVTTPVSTDGTVSFHNGSSGTVQLVADVAGYYLAGGPLDEGGLGPVPPYRMLDTRNGTGGVSGPVGAGSTVQLPIAGRGWVLPSGVSAVVLNVTAASASRSGWVAVWGAGAQPATSSLNFDAGKTMSNLVVTPVAPDGTVSLHNGSPGTVQLIADVFGYVLGADREPVPTKSTSRYVRNLSDGGTADRNTMDAEGCSDAGDDTGTGPYLHLLHIGAQSQHAPLSVQNPGVALTGFSENATPRLTYPQLVNALEGYLDGYERCRPGSASVTIAVGTNNDGDWQQYTAPEKGTDWAMQVIKPLAAYVSGQAGLEVVGANDIEAGFASTEAQAEQWESAYLAGTQARLVFDGSADACPTGFGASGPCGAVLDDNGVTKTWTLADYATLAHGVSPDRMLALPQVYVPQQAWQWANISFASGGQVTFAGALTERAAVPDQYTSVQGWGALWDAISANAQVSLPAPPVATDLQADWSTTMSAARNANATLPNG